MNRTIHIAIRFKSYFARYISVVVLFYALNRTMNQMNRIWIMWFAIHVHCMQFMVIESRSLHWT